MKLRGSHKIHMRKAKKRNVIELDEDALWKDSVGALTQQIRCA